MKKNISVIFLCFLAGLFGANVTPLLTGTGKLVFPETSPSANLSASSGKLSIASGGINQHLLLTPSGTGSVGVMASDPTFAGHVTFPALATAAPIVVGNSTTAPNLQVATDSTGDFALEDYNAAAWTIGVFQQSGRVGIGGVPGAANTVDVFGGGTVNVGTGYKVANVAGFSGTVTVVKTATGATTCTMIFSGGIKTGGTC